MVRKHSEPLPEAEALGLGGALAQLLDCKQQPHDGVAAEKDDQGPQRDQLLQTHLVKGARARQHRAVRTCAWPLQR